LIANIDSIILSIAKQRRHRAGNLATAPDRRRATLLEGGVPQMGDDSEFRDLMRRVREGSEEAAWTLVERYGEMIRRAVRRALNQRLRSKFDSSDFVQLVWSSFFRIGCQPGHFERPEELVAFLVTVARNKVGMEVRRLLQTEKCNLNREQSLNDPQARQWSDIADRQPSCLDVVLAQERWNRICQDQPEHYRKIIELRLQGHTNRDIADTLHLAESTVRRFLKRLLQERVA